MARKTKTEIVKTVPRPSGLAAVYERDRNGHVTRTVRPVDDTPADEPEAEEA